MIYDFKCPRCDYVQRDVSLKLSQLEWGKPPCPSCGNEKVYTHISSPPMVHFRDYELKDGGFIAHGIKGKPVVTSRAQNRELMKRHNLLDANQLGPPPTHLDQEREVASMQQTIDNITPTDAQLKQMKSDGIADIV